ncbi:DUF2927 domain-containing protein [Pararhodobacter zhoushanensis]|uniref:DUF2927 domain-containing protein n=1 Tax=Pararhodobacter zhoushanensis TaxID=2479545 RepID=A0ABT3H1N7_9RHOB|nr:DUF2927 domain-containing protein [Pararhodobacter zhoushanensis]MCW1933640.1 DUF2927 domain-containing protein [Pararhodobacter zhoushanensis]
MRSHLLALSLVALAACTPTSEVARLQAVPPATTALAIYRPGAARPLPPSRPNAEMARDFIELGFAMESGRAIPAFSRFEGPVTIVTRGAVPATAIPDLDHLISRLRAEAGINVSRADEAAEGANLITVEFLPRRQMQAVVPAAACFVVPNVSTWQDFVANRRSAAIDWTRVVTRTRAAVFIPDDTTPQEIRDCLHEEIGQAFGPLNDLFRLSDSIFNDDNFQTTLTGFDMLLLRVWYAPELQPGMTRDQVSARLPTLFNRLNPAGRGSAGAIAGITPRAWQLAVEQALSSDGGLGQRRAGAERALEMARAQGWTDARYALSLMLNARLAPRTQGESALDSLLDAASIYRRSPGGEVHAAHIDMHLAVQALATGQTQLALDLTAQAMPLAERTENAAFLASLGFIRAEALAQAGRENEAERLRLDSMPAARYGFGSEDAARARMEEIARIGGAAQRLARL